MSDFFGDILGMVTGQKKASPYTQSNYGDILSQATGDAAQSNIAFNQQLAPAYRQILLDNENAYDPNSAALRQGTTKTILDQLNLGTALPADLQQQVIQNALQTNAASGFGASAGGQGLVAKDLGLTGLDLLNQRINLAGNYGLANSRQGMSLYQPQTVVDPLSVSGGLAQDAANKQMHDVEEFNRKEGNKIAAVNTFGRVAGGVLGGVFGGPGGAMMGSQIGGSLISNPYSNAQGAGGNGTGGAGAGMGGNLFESILGGSKGGGGFGGGMMGGSSGAAGGMMFA